MSSTNTETPAPSRSAAREFYLCLELRQHLLGLLEKRDLTSFIRVERKCVFDVAKRLYQTMDYVWVRAHMTVSTRRTALTAAYLKKYNPTLFNLMVPPMRKKCPGLRRMLFGANPNETRERRYGEEAESTGDSWVVHFDPEEVEPEEPKGKRSTAVVPQTGGRIDFHQTVRLLLAGEPPADIPPPASPSEKYHLNYRFNLHMFQLVRREPASTDKWIAALRDRDSFGALYKSVKLATLPVTFDDLVVIYGRQDAAGYTDRLERIIVPRIVPWVVHDFRTFATVASGSLTCLILHNNDSATSTNTVMYAYDGTCPTPRSSYDDLPAIIEIIQTTLPNLSTLRFALSGIENAEAVCRGALDDRVLTETGSITSLRIHTPRIENKRTPMASLFNTIRLASRLCTKDAKISFDQTEYYYEPSSEQSRFVQYLWQQSPERQTHLAQHDFGSLGLVRLKEVIHLGFHPDNRPMGLWEKKVQELDLRRRLQAAREPAKTYWSAKVQGAWQKCADIAAQIEAIASAATTAQMSMEVESMRSALDRMWRMQETQGSRLRKVASEGDSQLGGPVRDFARLLRKLSSRSGSGAYSEMDTDTETDSDDLEMGWGMYPGDSDSDGW